MGFGFRHPAQHITSKHVQDVNVRGGDDGTPLHAAPYKSHLEVSQLLLAYGVDSNIQGSGDQNSLHLALKGGYPEVGWLLLDHGGDVNARQDQGNCIWQ